MQGLCKYKNIFGKPNTGVHSYKLFDLAIVDIAVTLLAVYAISLYFDFSFWYTLAVTFIIMVISHRLFCVRTTTDKWLFPNG